MRSLIAAAALAAQTLAAQATEVDHDEFREIFGRTYGQYLVVGVEKACPFVRQEIAEADPEALTMLFTDETAERFYSGTCGWSCSLFAEFWLTLRCQWATGQRDCQPLAAFHQGRVYDLSIDPSGATVYDCLDADEERQ